MTLTSNPGWHSDGRFGGEVLNPESANECVVRNHTPFVLYPLHRLFGLAKSGYEYVVSTVPGLLFAGAESAIFRVVPFVVVLAVYGFAVIIPVAQSPVLKVAEVVPLATHQDSPTTVSSVVLVRFSMAPSHHSFPDVVQTVILQSNSYPPGSALGKLATEVGAVFPIFNSAVAFVNYWSTTSDAEFLSHGWSIPRLPGFKHGLICSTQFSPQKFGVNDTLGSIRGEGECNGSFQEG
jgi:hypothetical protein